MLTKIDFCLKKHLSPKTLTGPGKIPGLLRNGPQGPVVESTIKLITDNVNFDSNSITIFSIKISVSKIFSSLSFGLHVSLPSA